MTKADAVKTPIAPIFAAHSVHESVHESGYLRGRCTTESHRQPLALRRRLARYSSYYDPMAAEPVEHHEDPLDPQRILRELPGQERANFLAAYREALDGARDPAGWGNLRRVLRLWSGMVIATNRPGFYEAQEAALAGSGGGMLLEDYIRLRRTQA